MDEVFQRLIDGLSSGRYGFSMEEWAEEIARSIFFGQSPLPPEMEGLESDIIKDFLLDNPDISDLDPDKDHGGFAGMMEKLGEKSGDAFLKYAVNELKWAVKDHDFYQLVKAITNKDGLEGHKDMAFSSDDIGEALSFKRGMGTEYSYGKRGGVGSLPMEGDVFTRILVFLPIDSIDWEETYDTYGSGRVVATEGSPVMLKAIAIIYRGQDGAEKKSQVYDPPARMVA